MKSIKKRLIFTSLVAGLLTTLMIGGTSASADTTTTVSNTLVTKTNTVDFSQVTKAKDIYNPYSFMLSTSNVSDLTIYSNDTLEDFITNAIRDFKGTIDISNFNLNVTSEDDMEQLAYIINRVHMYNPEFFYMDGTYGTSYNPANGKLKYIKINYIEEDYNKSTYDEQIAYIDDYFADLLNSLTDDMTDVEKALLIHDYICTNFSYDLTYSKFDMYSFVTTGSGVCQAYMLTYDYLLSKVGIDSYPVMSDSLQHTWNMIQIGDNYYQVDVTWDDYTPELYGYSNHDYFMLSDETISYVTNRGAHGDDWYLYDDISATDATYEDYGFRSTKFPFVTLNGVIYCIDYDGNFCTYTSNGNTMTVIKPLVNDDTWLVYGDKFNSFYKDKYASLNVFDDILIYNTPSSIVAMDTDGNVLDTILAYDDTSDGIFGITIGKDGVLLAQVESILNVQAESFGSKILSVCDVSEWYENYKLNPPVTTTEEVTTTPEVTTTTEETTTTTTEETTTTTTEVETTTEPTTTTPEETTTTEEVTTTPEETTTTEEVTTTTEETTTEATTTAKVTTKPSPYADIADKIDLNGDGTIDCGDLLNFMEVYNNIGSYDDYTLSLYDLNDDGQLNIVDILIIKSQILNY